MVRPRQRPTSVIESDAPGRPRRITWRAGLRFVLGRVFFCAGLACVVAPVAALASESDRLDLPARGVIRPVHKATIATDLLARVSELPLKEGDRFAAGDLLVAFDCRRYEAEIDCIRLAFIALNAANFADFVVEQPIPVDSDAAEGLHTYHYARPFSLPATNMVLALPD